MTFSATTILVLALIAAAIITAAVWAYTAANRLDRLHVRTDQARHALDAALARRAVVARSVATTLSGLYDPALVEQARRLTALADRAERSNWRDRETVENQLAAALSAIDVALLPPQQVAELADAEARVLIARRFHNDAVRDTLALRTRRLVRWVHLAGTAPLPTYFEIAERVTPAASTGLEVDTVRTSARVVLVDEHDRVLLLQGIDPKGSDVPFWFTIGGGVHPGETLREAAIRELYEETGHAADSSALRGPLWRRVAVFPFNGELIRSEELFFALRTKNFEVDPANRDYVERRSIIGNKWCTPTDIAHLDHSGETVYPYHLDQLLPEALAAADAPTNPEVRSIR
ncbi:NUDIX domain-containing protein [Nocardia yunnanensis]|uniref:NUDIX domain-containing protein n=1 Tax=Nocardia yunnanensis TaxID=2382165 RepID=A0A386ZP09_9NOCA|nr:NUDIX domain-containing protein [Nocardia yunnanensis]AYF79391.1 NUDIX domain-containing protein [Nocardia yunnanensis]